MSEFVDYNLNLVCIALKKSNLKLMSLLIYHQYKTTYWQPGFDHNNWFIVQLITKPTTCDKGYMTAKVPFTCPNNPS